MVKSSPAKNLAAGHETSREPKNGLTEHSREPKNGLSEISLGSAAVTIVDGQPMASSYEVAQTFGKRHAHVLRAIESLDCSAEFRALNFKESEQTQKNGNITKQIPFYRMTFDGFVFLVGGFTGKKAAAFKEAYIARFNLMREELARRASAQPASVLRRCRLMVSWDFNGQQQVKMMPEDACVLRPSEVAGWVADPEGRLSDEQAREVARAALLRLRERGGNRAVHELLQLADPEWLLVLKGELVQWLYRSVPGVVSGEPGKEGRP